MNEKEINRAIAIESVKAPMFEPKSGQESRRERRKAERTYKMRRSGFLYLLDKQKSEEPRSYTK